jgi:hypothetical protein
VFLAKQAVDVMGRKVIALGPWLIEAEPCNADASEKKALVTRKAVRSMDHFMTGSLEYYLEVPCTPAESPSGASELFHHVPIPLVFEAKFRKGTRPPAWKNTDEKIQDALPLLSVPESSPQDKVKEAVAAQTTLIVRVTLDRRSSSD